MKQRTINDYCKMNLIKNLTTVILLFATVMTLSAKTSRIDSLSLQMQILEQQIGEKQQKITIIQKELGIYEKEMSAICEHVDRANEEISNQIAASSHTIQVWGWILAILAIAVTVFTSVAGALFARYINKIRRDISHLTSEAKDQLHQAEDAFTDISEEQQRANAQQQEVKKIQEDTEEKLKELQNLHSDIQNNMSAIYEKLKREETTAWLKRLENIPEDITNVGDILLTRQLSKSDFPIMLNAYRNLIKRSMEVTGGTSIAILRQTNVGFKKREGLYALQFTQHFMDEAIKIEEIRVILRPRFSVYFKECFFRNDAEKCTEDLKKGVRQLDEGLQVEIIAEYISAMSQSQYSKFIDWYKILLADLAENQLEKIWRGVTKDNVKAIFFAQTIKEVLISINPQSPVIAEISAYIKNIEQQNLSQDLEAT